jgi:hypothetical protein
MPYSAWGGRERTLGARRDMALLEPKRLDRGQITPDGPRREHHRMAFARMCSDAESRPRELSWRPAICHSMFGWSRGGNAPTSWVQCRSSIMRRPGRRSLLLLTAPEAAVPRPQPVRNLSTRWPWQGKDALNAARDLSDSAGDRWLRLDPKESTHDLKLVVFNRKVGLSSGSDRCGGTAAI